MALDESAPADAERPLADGPLGKLPRCCPPDRKKTHTLRALGAPVQWGGLLGPGQLQTLARELVFQGRSGWV